jgi:hypothetical protein
VGDGTVRILPGEYPFALTFRWLDRFLNIISILIHKFITKENSPGELIDVDVPRKYNVTDYIFNVKDHDSIHLRSGDVDMDERTPARTRHNH